jgi:flagellar biosynthesis GTPase FlhF
MRTRTILAAALLAVLSLTTSADVLSQLKIDASQAATRVLDSLTYGHVDVSPVRSAFKAAAPAVRAALVEQVLAWTKAYVSSAQFAKAYAQRRDEAKPEKEERVSVDEELKQRREQRLAELEESKRAIASMPAEYRASAEEGLKVAMDSIKQMDTPEFRQMEREGLVAERADDAARFEESLGEWNASYPADPKQLVKRRLTEFLAETEDVDWNAALVNRNGKMRFANEEYESKPANWKLAFRAGREPLEKARAFAQAWLREL